MAQHRPPPPASEAAAGMQATTAARHKTERNLSIGRETPRLHQASVTGPAPRFIVHRSARADSESPHPRSSGSNSQHADIDGALPAGRKIRVVDRRNRRCQQAVALGRFAIGDRPVV